MSNNMVKKFLNNCTIVFDDWNQLDGMLIPRETLLSTMTYDNIKELRHWGIHHFEFFPTFGDQKVDHFARKRGNWTKKVEFT